MTVAQKSRIFLVVNFRKNTDRQLPFVIQLLLLRFLIFEKKNLPDGYFHE